MADLLIQGISKSFPTAGGVLEVLRGADLAMTRGDAAVITGPSGTGKSTLLYIVGLLEPPTAGQVELLGETPIAWEASRQARYRNEHIGFVFQDHHLLPQCTVLENVLLPIMAGRAVSSDDEQRATGLLERVGLKERASHRPAQLSGGERQRAALCRALINEPEIILADEPTGNLDSQTARIVGNMLLELARDTGTMLLCVTHSLELAERFPRQFVLREGRLDEERLA